MAIGDLVDKAEREVARILQQLEEDSGSYVESIDIHDTEVTNISSTTDEWERMLRIYLKRLPGTNWSQSR